MKIMHFRLLDKPKNHVNKVNSICLYQGLIQYGPFLSKIIPDLIIISLITTLSLPCH